MIDADGVERPYDVTTRLADQAPGSSSPEAHIGTALAGCFSMSLAQELEASGFNCVRIETTAIVRLYTTPGALAIDSIALHSEVEAPGISDRRLEAIAQQTKRTCVIASALAAVLISLEIEHFSPRDRAQ